MQVSQQVRASAKPTWIDLLSDSDFIAFSRNFSKLPSIEEKVAFIISNSKTGEGIFESVVRLINGRVYSYGFEPEFEEISKIVLALHTQLCDKAFDEYNKELAPRLHTCRYNREVVNLLEAELKEFKGRIIEARYNGYRSLDISLGYDYEVQKRTDVYRHPNVNLIVNIETNKVFYETVQRCSLGAAMYRFEMHLEELLEEAKRNDVNEVAIGNNDSVESIPINRVKRSKQNILPPLKDCELADFIEPALFENLLALEKQLHLRLEKWLQGEDKIHCAGFLGALFQKGYFTMSKPPKHSLVNNEVVCAFAWWRYGLNLSVQLSPQKTAERQKKIRNFLSMPNW